MSWWKLACWSLLVMAVGAVAYSFAIEAHRKANPQSAFSSLVGIRPPAGVRVIGYAKPHAWLLEGETDALRKVVDGRRFERSDEDAKWLLPEAARSFSLDLNPDDLAEGYELEGPRDSWLLIVKGRARAIYIQ